MIDYSNINYSCHPRSRKRLETSGFLLDKRVIQHEPLGFNDYNCLQMNAFAVVSDSGTLPEELFIVVVGHGLIQERNISTGETVEFEVSGDKIEAIHMIPGWTHNIINLSETENLVTVMTCNEIFNPNKPDTFFEVV